MLSCWQLKRDGIYASQANRSHRNRDHHCHGKRSKRRGVLADLERAQRLDEAMRALERAKSSLDDLVASRNMACMRAIGYAPFCSCLAKDMPVAFSFDKYIAITTRSKEQNGYAGLPAETRKAYDIVPGIRDRCVGGFPKASNGRK